MEQKMSDQMESSDEKKTQIAESCFISATSKECTNTTTNDASKIGVFQEEGLAKDSYGNCNRPDFKETLKYKDCESYASQHHHSIGTGLYLTDEINDLPPRFKDKVIKALENAASLYNIPLNMDPVRLLNSVSDASNVNIEPVTAPVVQNIQQTSVRHVVPENMEHIYFYNDIRHQNYPSNSYHDTGQFKHFSSKKSKNSDNFCMEKQSLDNMKDSLHVQNSSYFDRIRNESILHKIFPNLESSKEQYKTSFKSNEDAHSKFTVQSSGNKSATTSNTFIPSKKNLKDTDRINKNHCKKSRNEIPCDENTSNKNPLNSLQCKTKDPLRSSVLLQPQKQNKIAEIEGKACNNQSFQSWSTFIPVTASSNVPECLGNFSSRTFNKSEISSNFKVNANASDVSSSKGVMKKLDDWKHNSSNHERFYDSKKYSCKSFGTNSVTSNISKNYKSITTDRNLSRNNSSDYDKYKNRQRSPSNSVSSYSSTNSDKFKNRPSNSISSYSSKSHNSEIPGKSRSDFNEYTNASEASSVLQRNDKTEFSHKRPPLYSMGTKNATSFLNDSYNKRRFDTNSAIKSNDSTPICSDADYTLKMHGRYQYDRKNKEPMLVSSKCLNPSEEKVNKKWEKNKVFKTVQQSTKSAPSGTDGLKADFDINSVSKPSQYFDDNRKQVNLKRNDNLKKNKYPKKNDFAGVSRKLGNSEEIKKYENKETNENYLRYQQNSLKEIKPRGCIEDGFFLKVEVSEDAENLENWLRNLKTLFSFQFDVEYCCKFSNTLIITFENKEHALKGLSALNKKKKHMKNSEKSRILDMSNVKYHIIKPCNCKQKVISDCITSINENACSSLKILDEKCLETERFQASKKSANSKEVIFAVDDMLKTFDDSKRNFVAFQNEIIDQVKISESLKSVKKLKFAFIRECNIFSRCLPIYSRKDEILNSVRFYSVSVIVADTGSGKSTQVVEYLLHSNVADRGQIICTQPRKLAAISVAQYVSGQMGSAVGKIVGYDVGVERKLSEHTKIKYMTDYRFLKEFLNNNNLKGISCVIIDEAHERSLYTDLVLGMLKTCLQTRPDLRAIITSATIDPKIFTDYFNSSPTEVIEVPGKSYPVEIVWWPEDIELGWDYVKACARKAYEVHTKEKQGDILVFLTSPIEADEAIFIFKRLLSSKDEKPLLFCLHGKSDLRDQMQIFQPLPQKSRKIVFATNIAETSVTIPGIKYVIDSGMTKELAFDSKKNKSYLSVTFINEGSAVQRTGRAGRTQFGVCYRIYSENNFKKHFPKSSVPEILKTNLQKALLKIFELGINPQYFNFIEAPPNRTISNAIDSLEYLGAIENNKLTDLGRKLSKLSLEPQLGKLIFLGMKADIAYEMIIIAALVSEAGKLFIWSEENRSIADEKKKKFCHVGGDLCTYLEIYKRWKEIAVPERYIWCLENYVSSKALHSAAKTVDEVIICLRTEFSICITRKYNNTAFKKQYEKVLFDGFSENLCVSSGHPKLGYLSPYLPESFFIHPSSTLSFLGKDIPNYLVYSTLMETSRNYLFDITPISEETIKTAYLSGSFKLPLHFLKCLQSPPKIMGPYGESVLIRYILGKQGIKIKELEAKIKTLSNTKNIQIDVDVEKGLITLYVGEHFHEKIANVINHIIEQAHLEMLKEEDVIKLLGGIFHCGLGAGGIINDIIMPGEFREITVNDFSSKTCTIEQLLESYGPLQSIQTIKGKRIVHAVYRKVCHAVKAYCDLNSKKLHVSSKPYLPNFSNKTLPLYTLNVSWCRVPCIGSGLVRFLCEEDLIRASGILTHSSFFLGDNYVHFTPSNSSTKELRMKNLPKTASEDEIKAKLNEYLPQDLHVEKIMIFRKEAVKVRDVDLKNVHQKLLKLFEHYATSDKIIIDVKQPKYNDYLWKACVYFECIENGEDAFRKLKDCATIDSYLLSIEKCLKSTIHCTKMIFNAVKYQVYALLENKQFCENYNVEDSGDSIAITLISLDFYKLNALRWKLMCYLQGESLNFIGKSKYHFIFSDNMKNRVKSIEKKTETVISLNKIRKVITIYGSSINCHRAKEEIYFVVSVPDSSSTRSFNLLDSCKPPGFMKTLYMKYGYDLQGLVDTFLLRDAKINASKSTLTLCGSSKDIMKAEQALEKMCGELYDARQKKLQFPNAEEICSICLDPVTYDFLRLEHCGHVFCHQCLLLQLESATFPLVCVKENCEKLIFLEDIKRILSFGDSHLKKSFCAAALQYHIRCNVGKLSYCPTPDCQMIYRITDEGSEFKCPACKNSFCTHCQTMYHFGMSCDMFQNSQRDEDYSLKTWVKENESERKFCPSCKVVIEKVDGCNHMECLSCKAHLCWLCLRVFPSGEQVYDHMPFCEKNQS